MRLLLLTILICSWLFTALLLMDDLPTALQPRSIKSPDTDSASHPATVRGTPGIDEQEGSTRLDGGNPPLVLELYEDPAYGFALAVPVGWTRIVAAELESDVPETDIDDLSAVGSGDRSASLEPGYAVGFESGLSAPDGFIDYILIEILPGSRSGLFDADLQQRRQVVVDGRRAGFDRLEITASESDAQDIDLLVLQAELSGIGYTIGLYAIGRLVNEPMLALVFEAMLQTFEVRQDPFTVG